MPSTQSEQIDRQRVALGGKTHLWADRVRLLQGASCLAEALAVTVDTLAYRGCWVEELAGAEAVDRAALACAIGQAALAERRDEAGGLISLSDGDALAALKQAGWQAAGAYYVLSWSA